jgi:hypothetical protein
MDRLGDVLERRGAQVVDLEVESLFDLAIGVLGKADRSGLRDTFEARGDVDAVAHKIVVALFHDIADMNPDAEKNPPILWHTRVSFD